MDSKNDTNTSVSQITGTSDLSPGGTSVGASPGPSTEQQSAHPKEVVTIDTTRYSSKEVKVEKIVIR